MDIEKLMEAPTAKRGMFHSLKVVLNRFWERATRPVQNGEYSRRRLEDIGNAVESGRDYEEALQRVSSLRKGITALIDTGEPIRKHPLIIDPNKQS